MKASTVLLAYELIADGSLVSIRAKQTTGCLRADLNLK